MKDAGLPPSLSQLFLSFLRLGLTAFGGPAMVSFVRRLAVQDERWLDEERFRTGVALCQTIPGATTMQTCAYVGLEVRGVRGAAVCFIGFALPAFLLMLGLSFLYARFSTLPAVAAAFGGLRALIVALIASAFLTFARSYLKRWTDLVIVASAGVLLWFGLAPVLVVLIAAVLGIVLALGRADAAPGPKVQQAPLQFLPLGIAVGGAAVAALVLLIFDRKLLDLSLLMMKVDLFAFGGGFASVPLMLHEVVDVRHWMDQKVFMDGIALGQVTPGPIVITSTFVGFLLQGPLGAVVATISVFLPSFVLVVAVAPFWTRMQSVPVLRKAVDGVLCSFIGLLATTAVRLGLAVSWSIPHAVLAAAALAALLARVDLIWVILAGAAVSLLIH